MNEYTNVRDSQIRIDIDRLVKRGQQAFLARDPRKERDIALSIMRLAGEWAAICERRMP